MIGVIFKAIAGFYYVSLDGNTYECKARGSFRNAGVSPVVGDRVDFSVSADGKGVIEKVHERKNFLSRPTIANIDKLFIVSSYAVPAPDFLMIDRLSAIALYHNIEPVIVFNKSDIGDFSDFKRIYDNAGLKCYVVSALQGEGVDDIKAELSGCVSAFAGNSGVGKSSIINAVFGNEFLKTGDVSQKLGRGKHTTRHTELFEHSHGGFIADTPGFSSLEITEKNYDFKMSLATCFPEFEGLSESCRFSSCSHTCENGCAVIEAVQSGSVGKTRFESYKLIYAELKDIKAWEKSAKR